MNNKNDIFKSEHTLQILKEIESNPKITQRHLSQKLEVSLGKINYLIHALIDKGIIEAKNFKNAKHKLAYMYLLTPHGVKTKIQLTHQFFAWKMQEYEKLKTEIESLKKEVSSASEKNAETPSRELAAGEKILEAASDLSGGDITGYTKL